MKRGAIVLLNSMMIITINSNKSENSSDNKIYVKIFVVEDENVKKTKKQLFNRIYYRSPCTRRAVSTKTGTLILCKLISRFIT